MTQSTSRSITKSHRALSKPTINAHWSKWRYNGIIADQYKQRGVLCHIGRATIELQPKIGTAEQNLILLPKKKTVVSICTTIVLFVVWASSSTHCLAALDLGASVEQPFDCLIVQNRQAVQSVRRPVDWTLKDNMVEFCATLKGHRGGHTPFVQAGAETSNTGCGCG